MMVWHIVTSAMFHAGTPQDGHMYFLSDTREIYRGAEPFTESVVLYTELPTTSIARNRLYINSTTLEGRIYDGTSWTTVIKPVVDEVTEDGTNPVSAKAVAAFVAAEIAKVAGSDGVVSALSWDSAEHLLTVTKGSKETEDIVFDGLGVTLTYEASTGKLQLADASGNAIGDAISLDLERFVTAGEYDAENKNIVLYFDAEKTDSVTIPVGDLVDTYTAEGDGKALSLTVEGSVVKGSIKISTASGNQITCDENGLYVAAVDISGKMDKVADAVDGDIAILDAEGNVVDSGKTFDDLLPNTSVYEGASLEEAITGHTPVKGDVAIVSEPIGETGKVQKTVHQFDGEQWKAFDSDYDASKIILPADWITTTKIGVHQTLTGGQATIATAGTDVATALMQLTAKESEPSITNPAASWTSGTVSEFKAYEVGTVVSISVTAQLSSGTYSYGRVDADGNYETNTSAGISATGYTFTDTEGVEKSGSNTAAFDDIEVTDTTSYKITVSITYDGSVYKPATNFKKASSTKSAIAASSASATTSAITGFRKSFYGTLTHKNDLTSTIIRSLTSYKENNTECAIASGDSFDMTIPVGCLRAVIAIPATIATSHASNANILKEVIDVNGMNTNINSAFGDGGECVQISVAGANEYSPIAYKVWTKDWSTANDTANTYKVTI